MLSCDPYEELKNELRSEQPCRYFFRAEKSCKFGDACAFSHDPSKVKPCKFYVEPDYECNYGEKCQFRHDKPSCPDDREKFDIKLFQDRAEFKLQELRRIYQREKLEARQKFGIKPFHHGKIPDTYAILTWEEATKHVYPEKSSVIHKIDDRPTVTATHPLVSENTTGTNVQANDRAICVALAEGEYDKKQVAVLQYMDSDEAKIKTDMEEQEKNDVMISVMLMEDDKEKKLSHVLQNSNAVDDWESKIQSDQREKEVEAAVTPLTVQMPTDLSTDGLQPETPTFETKPPTNTPTTIEAKKKQVSISPLQESIPTRLERKCNLIKAFYESLCSYFNEKNIKSWTPHEIYSLFHETLSVGLEDFHKFEQHLLLNALFDHWMPSLSDWAEFVTLMYKDIQADSQEENEEDDLQTLAAELLWWIKDKDDNPIFLGATFAGLLNMPDGQWNKKDIHYLIDTIICELDSKENVSGIVMAGMSKYMDNDEFAMYVNSYLLSMGNVDVTKCSCTTYECNCPLDLYWEEGLCVLEPIIEYGTIGDPTSFFSLGTQMIWDKVQTRMVLEELFFEKSEEDLELMMEATMPIPRTESELEEMYCSLDETYSMEEDSISTTESVYSEDSDKSDDGLVEYDVEEMEKGNLSLNIQEAAAFRQPEFVKDIDPNNNDHENNPDINLGAALTIVHETIKTYKKASDARRLPGNKTRPSPKMGKILAQTREWVVFHSDHVSPQQRRYFTRQQRRSGNMNTASKKMSPTVDKKSPSRQRKSPRKRTPDKKKDETKEFTEEKPADSSQKTTKKSPTTGKSPRRRRSKSSGKPKPSSEKETTKEAGQSGQAEAKDTKKIPVKEEAMTSEDKSANERKSNKRGNNRRRSGRKSGDKKQELTKVTEGEEQEVQQTDQTDAKEVTVDSKEESQPHTQASKEGKDQHLPEEPQPCQTWKGLCRNKGKAKCIQGMCANCCIQTDEECKVHLLAKKQKLARSLIPACYTGVPGSKHKRVDFNRITPYKHFSKRGELKHFLDGSHDHTIHRVSFGPHFGIRDEHVNKVAEAFGEQLMVLELGCAESGDGARLTDNTAFAISKYCPKLIKLKLESCTAISNEGLSAVLDCCPDLQYLEVSGHDKQRGKVTAESLEPLFSKKSHPNLRTLCLNDQDLRDDGVIRRLTRCRPALKIYNTDTYDYDRYMYWGGHWRY